MRRGVTSRELRWLSAFVLTMGSLSSFASAEENDKTLLHEFLQQAPAKWQEYRDVAQAVQGSWSTKTIRGGAERKRIEYKANGTCWLIVDEDQGEPESKGRAYCVNSRYTFRLTRSNPSAPWVLVEFHDRQSEPEFSPDPISWGVLYCNFPRYPISIEHESLADAIRDPKFVVRSVRRVSPESGQLEVSFDYPHSLDARGPDGFNPVQSGMMIVDGRQFYQVLSMELRLKSRAGSGTRRIAMQYQNNRDGIPIIKQLTSNESWMLNSGKTYEMALTIEFDLKQHDRLPPEKEFTLSAFGLPEPIGSEFKTSTPVYVWFLVSAGVLLLAAIAFRLVLRRYRK